MTYMIMTSLLKNSSLAILQIILVSNLPLTTPTSSKSNQDLMHM